MPPGPVAFLTPLAENNIEEWIVGWLASDRLQTAGVRPPGPLLLHGPPGTGKTSVTMMLAQRFASNRSLFAIDASRVVESSLGATSANITKASDAAIRAGAVLVLEEIDTLASSRSYTTSAEVENTRATTAIMRLFETISPIVATTNRLDVLDAALIRRCEYVVEMPIPTDARRRQIVARELGEDPGEISIDLLKAVPFARLARRLAALGDKRPLEVFADLLHRDRIEP